MDSESQEVYIQTNVDVEMPMHTRTFLLGERQIFIFMSICCMISSLCYALCMIQGSIKSKRDGGLKLFWDLMMFSEVMSIAGCLLYLETQYYLHSDTKNQELCALVTLQVSQTEFSAYGWLMVWLAFIVSVLRATSALTWMNQLTTVAQFKDMSKGIGILMATLLYLFPLTLVSRHTASLMDFPQETVSLCLPLWFAEIDLQSEKNVIIVGYFLGIIAAIVVTLRGESWKNLKNLALPICLITHFFPILLLCLWISDVLQMFQMKISLVLIYSAVVQLNSMGNLTCYKLLAMGSQYTSDGEKDKSVSTEDCSKSDDVPLLDVSSEKPPVSQVLTV